MKRNKYEDVLERKATVVFTQGEPESLNCQISCKLNTEQYENMSASAGMSYKLSHGADVEKAYEEAWGCVETQLLNKIDQIKEVFG